MPRLCFRLASLIAIAGAAGANPCVSSLALSANAVIGGAVVNGAIELTAPAPPGGASVTLSSSNPYAQVAERVIVPAGETAAAFSASTSPVARITPAHISASIGSCSAIAAFAVHPASLAALALSATVSRGNSTLEASVTLTGPAPECGAIVRLESSDPAVTTPATVTVPAGQMRAAFALAAGQSLSTNAIAITATYGAATHTALLSVVPGI
jgi:hypothetical protein